ncbi:NAC domain-containing protein 78 [Phtheirospermum japonicum]|uniref:NAC domain-containing protein 78 n=1 Tax=Phtheirospermum japonicum TaxID=374723 RepID=A0A830C587_9LAMI|nr:NAC domain-containing protein 78 [Phtheirospermum japonicum]
MSPTGKKKSSSSLLAPGFRFHPTDEELVRYYLRRKVCGKGFRFDAISDIDIYKVEPWDLPSFSKLKTRDLEWYFFSMLDKKYGNGARTNRATEKGYWKTTGKDRAVYHKSQIVGMKKTLVFHIGRAPKGQRSNWVMHEYRLADLELERAGIVQDAFVLCRVFQKSGSGPKNGEQYGAPFVDEEWEDDDLELVLKAEIAEEVDFGDVYLDGDDLEQILGSDVPSDASPLPLNSQSADDKLNEETAESVIDASQQLFLTAGEQCEFKQHEDENLYALRAPYEMDVRAVKREYMGESSKSRDPDDLDYLLDQPFVDALDGLPYGNVGFLEANDLTNPVETNTSAFDMLEEYLTYFDATDNNLDQFAFEPSLMLGSEDLVSDQALLQKEELYDVAEQASLPNGQLVNNDNDTAWPSDKLDSVKYESDVEYPFVKKASHMLGSIPAPPAFAAEFPSKDAVLRLNSLSQPSSSVHVTAGMIQIRNLITDGNNQSLGKHENFNIVLSFGFARGDDGSASLESSLSILEGKTVTTLSRSGYMAEVEAYCHAARLTIDQQRDNMGRHARPDPALFLDGKELRPHGSLLQVQVERSFKILEDHVTKKMAMCKSARMLFKMPRLALISTSRIEYPNTAGYNGVRDAREVGNFLWGMEQYFKGMNVRDEETKEKIATLYLVDIAMLWWQQKHVDIERGTCWIEIWHDFAPTFGQAAATSLEHSNDRWGNCIRGVLNRFPGLFLLKGGVSGQRWGRAESYKGHPGAAKSMQRLRDRDVARLSRRESYQTRNEYKEKKNVFMPMRDHML